MSDKEGLLGDSSLAYIMNEAMRWNCATEWDISERIQQMSPRDRSELEHLGRKIRERGDYGRILEKLDNVGADAVGEAEKVYFFFGLLDELGIGFDDVA